MSEFFTAVWDGFYARFLEAYYSPAGSMYNENSYVSIPFIVCGLFLGACIAAIAACYNRTYLGRLPRRLIRAGATDKGNAKTLQEIEYDKPLIRHALSGDGVLTKFVLPCEEIDKTKKEKYDFATARFYIPQELKARAEIRYEQKGNGLIFFLASIIGYAAIGLLALYIIPLIFALQ